MFEPETLLEDLDLPRMTAAELVEEIQRMTENRHRRAHFDYYNQVLGAIAILAEKVGRRMDRE